MDKASASFRKNNVYVSVKELERYSEGWFLDCEIRQLSKQTLSFRRLVIEKFIWFLQSKGLESCGLLELRQFLVYIGKGHQDKGGRWGNSNLCKPVRPSTIKTYHAHLTVFFRWLVSEGLLETSPMDAIAPPVVRVDQIQPFSDQQVKALLAAARGTVHPLRDEAIVLFLLDTGIRASELCSLRMKDVDIPGKKAVVLGKGNKVRLLYFGKSTTKALWKYLRDKEMPPESPLFTSERGGDTKEPLTRSGLLQLIERLGKAAKIEATRCSPHTFRHTFAISFLRNGGNVFSLQQMLGHTELKMTQRYVSLAEADIQNQHRQFSPADRMRQK